MKYLLFLMLAGFMVSTTFGQETGTSTSTQTDVSKAFEEQDPQEEIYRLQAKRANLIYRIGVLNKEPLANQEEINQAEAMIKYIDSKIESLQKIILSEEYAEKNGAPQKDGLTEEEYEKKKMEWKDTLTTNSEMQIKTVLTRYEFNKLPKDRQEKILSMPERYTIID